MKELLLSILFLSVSFPALAKTLGTVTVEGVNKKNAAIIREKLLESIPKDFNFEDLEKAMDVTFALGSFNGMEVYIDDGEGGKTNVIFKFIPVKIVKTISFGGNAHFNSLDLLNELGFNEGEGLTQEKIQTGVENIKKYYNLNGYLNAQISADILTVENSSDIVVNVKIIEQEPCRIDNIAFNSVNTPLNSDLLRKFKKYKGKIFTQKLLNEMQNEAVDYLFSERYFTAAIQPPESVYDAVKSKVNLNYVVEDPYAFSLVFEGNEIYNALKIEKEIKLDPDNRLSSSPMEDLTERITRFYKKNGYANITINSSENLFSQDFIRRVTFVIKEGVKVRIKNIIVEGSLSRPAKYYQNFVTEHSGDMVESSIYNSDEIEVGVKNLVTGLQNQGFLSAKVPTLRTDFDKTNSFATIRINLEEGPQTFINKISFNGIKNTKSAELQAAIGLAPNTPLQLSRLEESTNMIVELYRDKGFLEVQVVNRGNSIISYSADNTKADLTFEINEGPLITVNSIVVEGNNFTKDYVILRELQFHPGEILTPDKVSYSETRLERLSIFNSVDIRTLEDDPRQGNRTVLVRVAEHNPGIFKTGVGVNNDLVLTLKGYVGSAYRNLFGTGRGVNARFEFDEKLQSNKLQTNFTEFDINLGYTEPFVIGTKGTGRLNFSRSNRLFSIDPITKQTLATDNAQGDVIYERDLTRKTKLIYEVYGLARTINYDIYGNNTPAVGSPPGTPPVPLPGALVIATTGPTILFDGRDNPFNPTRGYLASTSVEYSNPVMGSTSTVNYIKTVESYTHYIPLNRVVWANEGKLGYLKNVSTLNDGAVPQIKTFFLGGRSSIRGFDAVSESIPLASDVQNGVPDNEYFILAKSELRFPIVGNLGGAIFYDGGTVRFPGYNPQFPWRDAVGFGFRYNTPVGPVSLEIGWKLNQDNAQTTVNSITTSRNEAPYQIHFSIGVF